MARLSSVLFVAALGLPLYTAAEQKAVANCIDAETAAHAAKYLARAEADLSAARTPYDRWIALTGLVLRESATTDEQTVRKHISELRTLSATYRDDWNYGNAVHKANLALAELALRDGDMKAASAFLLDAGKTPGSPQLDSFGPNMAVACELVERGERKTVLQYFELCRKFWENGSGALDRWSAEVKAGKKPRFGANLVY